MTKLSDTQLIILSSALKHPSGLATRPVNLPVAAAKKVAIALVDKGFMREVRAGRDAPVWSESEDGRFALKITRAGRQTIGGDAELGERAATSRTDKSSRKARAAKAGVKRSAGHKGGQVAVAQQPTIAPPRASSKQAAIIALMIRPQGVTLDELVAATEWLPHTTRAALTGLRKRGYAIVRERHEGSSRYRVADREAAAAA